MSLYDRPAGAIGMSLPLTREGSDQRGRSLNHDLSAGASGSGRESVSLNRAPPTSAEIDAVIAAAMASAPPAPTAVDMNRELSNRALTPLMTNILPAAIGSDGRVNLFVGNLPYRVRWQDLKDLFRKAGTVLRADVSLGPDNRSRGYGNVLMGSREDAARAIDRFNGYSWQTRTLEVRPDRLPPEYEPQPHVHHKPMFGFHGGPHPLPIPGHLTPNGPMWIPPGGPRPGAGGMPVQQGGMLGAMPVPGMNVSPHLPHLQGGGVSPALSASPGSTYGPSGMPLPIVGQHTGGPAAPNLGASPLAGSLTAGSGPTSVPQAQAQAAAAWNSARRESLTPFAHVLPNDGLPPPRSASPVPPIGSGAPTSRPSSHDGRDKPPSPPRPGTNGSTGEPVHPHGRAPPPGHLGPLPPSMFAGVKAVVSPEVDPVVPPIRRGSANLEAALAGIHPPMPMNGLANQAKEFGSSSTLIDRVVFVQNLPLSMQWQELKDMFRPAGVVLRADVATTAEGRSRGFGTVLFASEGDANNAVQMLHGHSVEGQTIRVQTERQSLEDKNIHPLHQQPAGADIQPSFGFKPNQPLAPGGLWPHAAPGMHNNDYEVSQGDSDGQLPSPIGGRIPWSLNTTLNGGQTMTPVRPSSARFEMGDESPHFGHGHHPGPINLPPFPLPGDMNPLSPLQTRGLPPMTPSMPGFVFNAYPQTPPIHAPFLSPGSGPFSPGQQVTSPIYQMNPFLNAAPGAPISRFPQSGSAALGTPTTQAFPPSNAPSSLAGAPGARLSARGQSAQSQAAEEAESEDYFPPVSGEGLEWPSLSLSARASATPSPLNARDRLASTSTEPEDEDEVATRALADRAGKLALDDGADDEEEGEEVELEHPPTPTRFGKTDRSSAVPPPAPSSTASASQMVVSNGTTDGSTTGQPAAAAVGNGRISLDANRPTLPVAWNSDRRASWSDIAARGPK